MSMQMNNLDKNDPIVNQPGQQPQAVLPPGYQPISQQPMMGVPGYPPPLQPGQDVWMSTTAGIPNWQRGLEYLSTVDHLLVKQKIELTEAFTGFETNNKFTIKNSLGQKVFWAIEDSNWCARNCLGSLRAFDMKIFDATRTEVMHLYRPFACNLGCPCGLQSMDVSSPPGNIIGRIEEEYTCCYPHFSIKNQRGEVVLRIEGPMCTFNCGGDIEFKVLSLNGQQVGKISKQWTGFIQEVFTDADVFGVTFPLDLDVHVKATLLGATFLIDAMFFENNNNR